jgi:hypothetical protein
VHPTGISVPPHRYLAGISSLDGTWGQVDSRGMRISVLGPLEIDGNSDSLGMRDRVVLAALSM